MKNNYKNFYGKFSLIMFGALLVTVFMTLGFYRVVFGAVIEDDSLFDPITPGDGEIVGETPYDPPFYNNPRPYNENQTPTATSVPVTSSGGGGGGVYVPPFSAGGTDSGQPATNVPVAPPSNNSSEATPRVIKFGNDVRVFNVSGDRIRWIPSPEVFNSLGLDWRRIEQRPSAELSNYRRVRLIRPNDDVRVYYITERGMKRWIPTADVFNSYGNKWEDVVVVLPLETNAIRDVVLIREEGGSRVYKLENGTKRWITNENAFNTNNFKWDEIAPINKTELNSWPEGPSIN